MTRLSVLLSLLMVISLEAWSQPKIIAVVNSASYQAGLPYGGALATAYISGLSGLMPGTFIAPSSEPLPYSLGGIQVTVNGAFAPILAVAVPSNPLASVQVNFQVPLERNASLGPNTAPIYMVNGVTAASASGGATDVLPAWGGFFSDINGYAIAFHGSDSSPVTQQNPAHPGESIIAFADAFFATWPPAPIAIPTPPEDTFQPLEIARQDPRPAYLYLQAYPALIGVCPGPSCITSNGSVTNTAALQIALEGLAPGVVGVEMIQFAIPPNQQPGNWPLFFNKGSNPDGSGATCSASPPACLEADSSPYVLLPVAASN